jgi:hypothetical protein
MLTDNTGGAPAEATGGATTTLTSGAPATPTQGTTNEFISSLPETIRGNQSLSQFDSPTKLAESYVELEKKYQESMSKLPVVPNDASGYKLPDGVDAQSASQFLNVAHQLGLSDAQVGKLIEFDRSIKSQIVNQNIAQEKEAINTLRSEWGEKFDSNVEIAKQAVEKFGGPELKEFLEKSRLGNHPIFAKVFHKIGTLISEDSLKSGGGSPIDARPTMSDGKPMLKFPSMQNIRR